MYKKFLSLTEIFLLCFLLAACGTPKEKIAQAQEKYVELSEIHNQVVEAHKNVDDNSLDGELTKLQSRATELGAYNLAEMKEEEIDQLILDIDSMINEYENYLTQLSNIKGAEEDAVLTQIVISLLNNTNVSFSNLFLYEQGSGGAWVNVLEELELFVPGQYLTGLMVMRDVDNTPWIMELTDENGTEYELELAVGEYEEGNVSLALAIDGGTGEMTAEILEMKRDSDEEQEGSDPGAESDAGRSGSDNEEENSGNESSGGESTAAVPDGDAGEQ